MSEVFYNTIRIRHNEKLEALGADKFLVEWTPTVVDEEAKAQAEAEALERKMNAIFGSMGSGSKPQRGKVQRRPRAKPSGS